MTLGVDATERVKPRVEPWLRRVLAISTLSTLTMNALRPMIAYRALDLGAGAVEVGMIAASFHILAAVVALPIGRFVDRLGAGRFEVAAMVMVGAASLAAVVVDDLLVLAGVVAIMGLGQTINLVAQQTTVANRGGPAGRDERYGMYTQAGSVGQLLGPAIAGALAGGTLFAALGLHPEFANEQAPVFVMAALCCGVATVIAIPLARHRDARVPDATTALSAAFGATARRVLTRPGMLRAMVLSIVVVTSIDVLIAYLPVYGQQHDLSVGLVGLLLSVRAASGLVSRSLMGRLLRLLGRQRLLTGGLALAGGGMLLLALAPTPWLLAVSMAMFGLGTGLGQPITIAWVADQSPRSERATAIGIRLMGNRVALLGMPLLMGLIAGSAGIALTFAAVAMVLSAGAATAASAPLTATTRERPSVGT